MRDHCGQQCVKTWQPYLFSFSFATFDLDVYKSIHFLFGFAGFVEASIVFRQFDAFHCSLYPAPNHDMNPMLPIGMAPSGANGEGGPSHDVFP